MGFWNRNKIALWNASPFSFHCSWVWLWASRRWLLRRLIIRRSRQDPWGLQPRALFTSTDPHASVLDWSGNAAMRKLLAVLGILILSVIMLIFGAFGTAALLGIPLFIFYAIWGQMPRPTSNWSCAEIAKKAERFTLLVGCWQQLPNLLTKSSGCLFVTGIR